MKKLLMLSALGALLTGCYTVNDRYDNEPVGSAPSERGVYYDRHGNTFGPANSGPEAAAGPGTASGGELRRIP